MPGTVLILGANGRFGSQAAAAFWNACWRVRIFDRAFDDLETAAQGADVIVNAWNPPYTDWAATIPALTEAVIDAARSSGATVLIPGNVYVYGADAPEAFGPDTPHAATNPLGRIRTEMEAAYRAADIPVILLRAGDFLDTAATGNWFDKVIAKPAAKGRLDYPGALDAPHAWAYLPDLARAAEALARMRETLPRFADVPFPGYTLTGHELAEAASAGTGSQITAGEMCWMPVQLARPVWPIAKHLLEMRYLWSKPHHLDRRVFDTLLPGFRDTPVEQALARALEHEVHPNQTVAGRPAVAA